VLLLATFSVVLLHQSFHHIGSVSVFETTYLFFVSQVVHRVRACVVLLQVNYFNIKKGIVLLKQVHLLLLSKRQNLRRPILAYVEVQKKMYTD